MNDPRETNSPECLAMLADLDYKALPAWRIFWAEFYTQACDAWEKEHRHEYESVEQMLRYFAASVEADNLEDGWSRRDYIRAIAEGDMPNMKARPFDAWLLEQWHLPISDGEMPAAVSMGLHTQLQDFLS